MFNVELVKGRLKGFGIEAGENDEFALVFCTEKVSPFSTVRSP